MLHFPLYTFSNKISIFRDLLPEKCKGLWEHMKDANNIHNYRSDFCYTSKPDAVFP